jgi:hypothetical protein
MAHARVRHPLNETSSIKLHFNAWATYDVIRNDHGARYGRLVILASSSSPMTCSFTGSQLTFFPERMAMLPKWHTVADRWLIARNKGSSRGK